MGHESIQTTLCKIALCYDTNRLFNYHKNMKLRAILEPSDEGGYTVYVPSLPGCISEGENVDEALVNIQEAIELYLEPVEDEISSKEGIIIRELVL